MQPNHDPFTIHNFLSKKISQPPNKQREQPQGIVARASETEEAKPEQSWGKKPYLADVAFRHVRGRARERNSLVLAGELVSGMNILVASPA